jgi:hypothetical protein
MNTAPHDVITAFLDNEPFDATALAEALATDEGRTLLIDFVALRHVVQPDDRLLTLPQLRRWGGPVLWVAAAASIAVAAIGGYQVGLKRDAAMNNAPPTPTVVIKADAWNEISTGSR